MHAQARARTRARSLRPSSSPLPTPHPPSPPPSRSCLSFLSLALRALSSTFTPSSLSLHNPRTLSLSPDAGYGCTITARLTKGSRRLRNALAFRTGGGGHSLERTSLASDNAIVAEDVHGAGEEEEEEDKQGKQGNGVAVTSTKNGGGGAEDASEQEATTTAPTHATNKEEERLAAMLVSKPKKDREVGCVNETYA
jgi:hypothetical protein